MKPLRAIELTHAVPIDGRGKRSRETTLRLSERDLYLRVAAARFCSGMSDRQAAAWLHTKLLRYATGAWRRDCVEATIEATCPVRYRGTVMQMCWLILRTIKHVPSKMTIRRALAFRDPADVPASIITE